MNKYKEAQSKIARTLVRIIGYPTFASQVEKDFDVLDELVEKATPKEPTIYLYESEERKPTFSYVCSCCGDWVNNGTNYCSGCGQALDWSN